MKQFEESLISIIVPIYNVQEYLDRCIQSIIHQTYTKLEIILVNDGSTDDCERICRRYEKEDQRIRVISKENEGLSAARNEGILLSTGEYIVFVDSDDFLEVTMIQELYECSSLYHADICICDFFYMDEKRKRMQGEVKKSETHVHCYSNLQALEKINGPNHIQMVVAWNKLYHRRLFDDIRYPVGKINEDEFVIHKLFYLSERIVYIEKPLYYYVQRRGSIMNTEFSQKNVHIVEAYKERLNFYMKHDIKSLIGISTFKYLLKMQWFYKWFRLRYPSKGEVIENYREIFHEEKMKYGKYLSKRQQIILTFCGGFTKQYEKFRKVYYVVIGLLDG